MAAKDDSPTSLHGQPWSVWADRLGRDSPLSDTDDQSKLVSNKEGDAMKLPKKDMSFYGLCPVRDEFYLVTCNFCQRVCTPQGLKNHIELKHAQEWTSHPALQEPSESCLLPTAPTVSSTSKLKVAKKAGSGQAAAAVPNSLAYLLATPATPSRPRNNKRASGSKPNISHGPASIKIPTPLSSALAGTPYDKIPSPQQPPPVQFSPLQPTLTAPSPVSPLTTGGSLNPSSAITMTVAVDSSGVQTVQIHLPEIANGVGMPNSPTDVVDLPLRPPASVGRNKKRRASKSERRLLPLKEREFDPEKHCGVWISDIHRACTRSLTCKAHSLTLRRAVQGRSRSFDDLLAEHRSAKETLLKQFKDATGSVKAPPLSPLTVAKPPAKSPRLTSIKPPPAKKALLSSLLQSGSDLTVDVAAPPLPPPTTVTETAVQPSGLLQRVFPAPVSLSFTSHHPKPLAVCSFGMRRRANCRTVVADRKWDFLRTTLRSSFQRSGMPGFLAPAHHLVDQSKTNIELPNGLQLSIGVQPDGHNHHHRVRFKKGLLNGQQQQGRDVMDGFDGLVGEDGVLTFLNQGSEGTASLSLMADLSAGNITFSELMGEQGHHHHPSSASSSLILQDPGEPM